MSHQILILQRLSSGGHADVYLGQRIDNGEQVAVKFLREHEIPDARKAFLREIRILGLQLRGLIPLISWDMKAERPYYVMPLMGGSLTRYGGHLVDGQLHSVAVEVDAHGDIKPDNILLSHNGQLHVADPLGNGAHCTMLFAENHGGTPGYWAPEVRAGRPISRAGDIYSYGAMLYHLLTGRKPRDGQRLDPASEGYTNAPKIREIIVACCHFEPKARPTIQEVLRMLRGEEWAKIQAERKQRRELLTAACVVGGLFFLCTALKG